MTSWARKVLDYLPQLKSDLPRAQKELRRVYRIFARARGNVDGQGVGMGVHRRTHGLKFVHIATRTYVLEYPHAEVELFILCRRSLHVSGAETIIGPPEPSTSEFGTKRPWRCSTRKQPGQFNHSLSIIIKYSLSILVLGASSLEFICQLVVKHTYCR